ncbi:MAG TPA: hypothetical protein VI357_22045 [Mycobacteriales bacterium]
MLGVLRVICTVVGAVALYCAFMASLWYGVMRAGRRRARASAVRRAAARAVPVTTAGADQRQDQLPDQRQGRRQGRDRRARSWEELPSWLWRDRPWAVAVVLLGAPVVRDRTAPFVDFPNRVIDWRSLIEESRAWPPDQRLLVQSAYEMAFDTSGEVTRAMSDPVTLRELVRHLDDDEVERIRVAMQIRRGRLEPEDGITTLS